MQHYLTWMGGFIKKMLQTKYFCDNFGVDVTVAHNCHGNNKKKHY